MKIQELLTEGAFVIKSKDGVEKRFKKEGPESEAWSKTIAKKPKTVKAEKFSTAWWEQKEDAGDVDMILPWTKIDKYNLSSNDLEAAFENAGIPAKNVDHWTTYGPTFKVIDGVKCASINLNVIAAYTKDDDLGLDFTDRDVVSDSHPVVVARSPKDPKNLIFIGYA